MNVQMTREFNIPAVRVSEDYDSIMTNFYDCRVDYVSTTESISEINVAYSRMKHWFYEIMQNSILISSQHPDIRVWQSLPVRCLAFPDDPVDQIVGIMLWRKLTAIVQGRIEISGVSVRSPLDDYVQYHHFAEEPQGYMSAEGWWSDPRPIWETARSRGRSKEKVISLNPQPEWKQHALGWPDESAPAVTITEFARDEDQ